MKTEQKHEILSKKIEKKKIVAEHWNVHGFVFEATDDAIVRFGRAFTDAFATAAPLPDPNPIGKLSRASNAS